MSSLLPTADRSNPALVQADADFADEGGVEGLARQLIVLSGSVDWADFDDDDDDTPSVDCRLRYHDRTWYIYSGSSDYDQDHRGHWGASGVGPDMSVEDARSVALELIEQVLESIAAEGGAA